MTDHPSTPSPELVEQWRTEGFHQDYCSPFEHAIAQAAQWGADAELEACVKWIAYHPPVPDDLRAARRPKLPSLKAKALARTDAILNDPNRALLVEVRETLELNRRALEQLDD
jgi:hypothetical protein